MKYALYQLACRGMAMIKLRCTKTPYNGGLFTANKVYADVDLTPVNKHGGRLRIVKDNGKLLMAKYSMVSKVSMKSRLLLRDINYQGYVFRMIGANNDT